MARSEPRLDSSRSPGNSCRISSRAPSRMAIVLGAWFSGAQSPESPCPPAGDRRATLLVVAVDLDRLPYAVDMIRIAVGEGVHRGALLGVDDEDRADRRLAIVGDE